MKSYKITFILSLLGILLLIFLSQTKEFQTGKIQSTQYSSNKITIQLENSQTELIIFGTPQISLKENDIIKYKGKQSLYKNQKQKIIEKIYKI